MPTDAEYLQQIRANQAAGQNQEPIPIGLPENSMNAPGVTDADREAVLMAEQYQAQKPIAQEIIAEQETQQLDDVITIMRSDDLALQERVKRYRPELYQKYQQRQQQQFADVEAVLNSGDTELIQALKTKKPDLLNEYKDSQRNALVKLGTSIKDWVVNSITGKYTEGYEELPMYNPAVDTAYANSEQAAAIIREAATPSIDIAEDVSELMPEQDAGFFSNLKRSASQNMFGTALTAVRFANDASKVVSTPPAFKTAYPVPEDVFGNPLIALKEDLTLSNGKVIPADTPMYPNKPGMTKQDLVEIQRSTPEILAAAASGGQSFLAQLLLNSTAAMTMSATRQIATEVKAPSGRTAVENTFKIGGQALLEGGISAGFDVGAQGAHALAKGAAISLRRVFTKMSNDPNVQRFINVDLYDQAIQEGATPEQAFQRTITQEGAEFLAQRQITPEQLAPELLHQMVLQTRNPQSHALGPQYSSALAKSFDNSIVMSEYLGQLDPQLKKFQAAEAALLSSRSEAGALARDRFAGDLARLQGAVEAQSGISLTPSAEFYKTAFEDFNAVNQASRSAASKKMDDLLDTLPKQGYGQEVIQSDGILKALDDLRAKHKSDPKFQGDIDTLEARLFEFGALDTPGKVKAQVERRIASMDEADGIARQRILNAADERSLRQAISEYEQLITSEITAKERMTSLLRQGNKQVRGQEFAADEAMIAARERGVQGSELSDLEKTLKERLDRFASFQGREAGIEAEGVQAAQHRKDAAKMGAAERKQVRLEMQKQRKLEQFNQLAAMRQQRAVADIQRKNGEAIFDAFTLEAGIRLNKALNQSGLKELPYKSLLTVKKALSEAIENAPTDDILKREFRKANKAWSNYMRRWDEHLPAARVAEAISKNNATIGNLAASGILQELKSAPLGANKSMMRALRQAKLRGVPQAHMVERNLQQTVMADIWDDIFTPPSNREGVGAATLEGFEKAMSKWGPNVPAALDKLDEIFTKEQSRVMRSMHQFLDSQRRKPVNSLTADGTESMFRTLWKQMSNSVWLATKTPAMAVTVTGARFTGVRREQAAARALSELVMNPYDLAERRLKTYLNDPLKYRAGMEGGLTSTAKQRRSKVEIASKVQGVSWRDMTPEQKELFNETYKNTYPALYEYQKREIKRAIARKVGSVTAREATTGDQNGQQ